MKIFQKRIMKLGNKGLTMVELICAVAIVSLLGTTVSSMMVVSANSYRRGSTETEVQQETQLVANQLSDLLIDASSVVKMNASTGILTIQQKNDTNTKIEIGIDANDDGDEFLPTDLTYKETEDGPGGTRVTVGGKTQLLAQNVVGFSCDDSTFETKGYVKVYLTVKKDGNEYPNIFTITTRNAERSEVAQVSEGPQVAILARRWLLEPNESLDLDELAEVANGAGDLAWSIETSHVSGTDIVTDAITGKKSLVISSAENQPMLKLKASVGSSVGYVNVFIRRVTGLTLDGNLVSGVGFKENAVYQLTPTVSGTSLNQVNGASYDLNYVSTRDIQYTITGSARSKVTFDDVNKTIKLTEDWIGGDSITVTAVAKHPAGVNKSGVAYDTITAVWELQSGILNLPLWWESNFRRGADSKVHVEYSSTMDFVQTVIKPEYLGSLSNSIKWFARYKSEVDSDWSIYHKMDQGEFTNFKVNANETLFYRLDENYQIDVAAIIYDEGSKTIYWPIDPQLFTQGFDPAQGWHFDDTKAIRNTTAKAEYSQVLTIAAAKVAFQKNPTPVFILGSVADPIIANKNSQLMISMSKESSLGISVGDGSAQYRLHTEAMEVFDASTNTWKPASDADKRAIESQTDNMNVKFTNRGATPGIYRAGVYVQNYSYKELNPTSVLNTITGTVTSNEDWKQGPAYSFVGRDAGGYIIFEVPGTGATPRPTATATPRPTATATPRPTAVPTATPTAVPGATAAPTAVPTATPTAAPTAVPGANSVNVTVGIQVGWNGTRTEAGNFNLVLDSNSIGSEFMSKLSNNDSNKTNLVLTIKLNNPLEDGSKEVVVNLQGTCYYVGWNKMYYAMNPNGLKVESATLSIK